MLKIEFYTGNITIKNSVIGCTIMFFLTKNSYALFGNLHVKDCFQQIIRVSTHIELA